jgi:hypothetical protein
MWWRYIGHILWKDNNNTKIAFTWAPEEKMKRGRPKESWRRITPVINVDQAIQVIYGL